MFKSDSLTSADKQAAYQHSLEAAVQFLREAWPATAYSKPVLALARPAFTAVGLLPRNAKGATYEPGGLRIQIED